MGKGDQVTDAVEVAVIAEQGETAAEYDVRMGALLPLAGTHNGKIADVVLRMNRMVKKRNYLRNVETRREENKARNRYK